LGEVARRSLFLSGRKAILSVEHWISEVLKQQTPSVFTALLVAYILGKHIKEQHKAHLASKDAEIERLVKEKNELQKLNQRLSTKDHQKDEQKPDAKSQKSQKGKQP
jgi:hypothetical protein